MTQETLPSPQIEQNGLPLPAAIRLEHPMIPHEKQIVNLQGQPLHDASQTAQTFGIAVPTVAKIEAGNQLFSVLDTRVSDDYSSPLLVVDESFHHGSEGSYKGLWRDEPLQLGRNHHGNRFDYLSTVSNSHFTLAYNGLGLVVANQQPTNTTLLSGDLVQGGQPDNSQRGNIRAVYTSSVNEDIRSRFDFGAEDLTAPYGYYKNHVIIGRKTSTVKDGVYFTTRPASEAVVVDDKSRALQQVAQGLLHKVERKFGKEPTAPIEAMLKLVNQYTREIMPYDERGADKLSAPHYDNNGLIGLSEYIEQGVGVCRHQCLVAAFLVETLVDNKLMVGRTGVERNHDVDANGAHAWAKFEIPGGQSFVIDPAQNFVGTKQKAQQEGRWKYDLPADR